jgi:hypothetical protein
MNEQLLLNNVYKKFQTTMIGALARFEENFGFLWDNDTKEAERFDLIWEETRNSILNNGNKQARSALTEISDYIDQNNNKIQQKYHYKFYFDKKDGNNQGEQK